MLIGGRGEKDKGREIFWWVRWCAWSLVVCSMAFPFLFCFFSCCAVPCLSPPSNWNVCLVPGVKVNVKTQNTRNFSRVQFQFSSTFPFSRITRTHTVKRQASPQLSLNSHHTKVKLLFESFLTKCQITPQNTNYK